MLLYCVVTSAVFLSLNAFVGCFSIVFCWMNLTLHKSRVRTAQIGRTTPSKSSYSSLYVVVTKKTTTKKPKKQYFLGHQGCYLFGWNLFFI